MEKVKLKKTDVIYCPRPFPWFGVLIVPPDHARPALKFIEKKS
jgi:hypothetical protein